ncbi:MAG: hypothetical protein SFY66_19780 [Oculatellaceae cyanobacterium bins.114]|nr:hypothetical protein [Oculatellaceae cyanobacterium bins.114]
MYTTIPAALTEVKTNPATRGLIGAEYDSYLTNLLTLSAGKDAADVTQYRPFYVAAKLLEQLRSQQQISKADGAEFTGLAKPIESLLGTQIAFDKALGLTIPEGFEAVLPKCVTCEGQSSGAIRRFGTRSQTTQIRP